MTSKLTFYGAVNEIGGNKIVFEDNGTKILLDFGMSFGTLNKYFSEFMQPRKCNGLGDFIEMGLIPDLKGLYRQDFLKHMGRKHEDLEYQGLLLSHAHADHASYITHIRDDLPIYCSDESYHILKAIDETSKSGSFNELMNLTTSFETYVNRNNEISRKTARTHPDLVNDRNYNIISFRNKFTIDGLEIEPFSVDHSLAGATGYIINSSEGVIVYTGDFRFHGRRSEQTCTFMDACKDVEPDVLIIEGTRITEANSKTELDIEDEVCSIASKSNGLTVCNWSIRDTDRMLSFLNAAKKLGKKLAISLKQAYLLQELSNCEGCIAPNLYDENIEIYASRKSWGLIGTDCCDKMRNEDYETWERDFLDRSICYKDLKSNQDEYMYFCSNYDLKELIDIQPEAGSLYIKSTCEPFDAEMEMEWERMLNWIYHFGMNAESTHVSGHASAPQLSEFVNAVNPQLIIPVHTENARAYEQFGKTHLLKAVGDSFTL